MTWILWLLLLAGVAPLGFIFAAGCCCGCTLLLDRFTTDSLAADFDQRAGSWSVGGGVASVSSANALIVTKTAIDEPNVFAKSYVSCSSVNEAARVVNGYVDDDNYWFGEVQAGSTFGGTLKLFQRVRGPNIQRGDTVDLLTVPLPGHGAAACGTGSIAGHLLVCAHDGGLVSAYFCCGDTFCNELTSGQITGNFTWMVQYDAGSFPASSKVGMGTGIASSAVTFDDFRFARHFFADQACLHCHHCPQCRSMADQLQLTVTGLTGAGACPGMNGTYTLRRKTASDSSCTWETPANFDGIFPGRIFVVMTPETKLSVTLLATTGTRVDAITDSLESPAGSATDCASWNGLNVPNITSETCNTSTASIYVTAL